MNIYPVSNNDISMQGKNKNPHWIIRQFRRFEQYVLDASPTHTTKEKKNSREIWDKTTNGASHPMWNRGILGATALLTQPTIDYYNHRVDDETRIVSRNRTIAKIIAGTLVGMFVVRGPVHKIVEKMTNPVGTGKYSKALLPKDYITEISKNKNYLKNYRTTVAMILALGAMCITNFVLDAPLTIILTNIFNEKSGVGKNENDAETSRMKEVANA